LYFAGFIIRITPMLSELNKNRLSDWCVVLYTLIVYGMQYVFTAIIVLIGFAASFLKIKRLNRFLFSIWAKGLFVLMGKRLRITGKHNYVTERSYLIVINHASIYDIPAVMSIVPLVSWIGREYLAHIPVFGRLIRMNNYIAIEPGSHSRSRHSLRQAVVKAKKGLTVAIFPEGTRSKNGKLDVFKKGFIHILKGTQLDVLPVTLNGFYSLKPKHRFTIRPKGRLEIVIHPPFKAGQLLQLSDREIIAKVKNRIQSVYREQ